jgi:DHA2 family multidrug resistance protein
MSLDTKQAAMIAYIDDYQLMMVLTIAVIPLLMLLRPVAKLQNS